LRKLFDDADVDGGGTLDFAEFEAIMKMDMLGILKKLGSGNGQDSRGLANVEPSNEKYFGEELRNRAPQKADEYNLIEAQYTSMKLYETRVASMQRFVAFCVMFHELGLKVQDWWSAVSFGLLAYRMDRTHSIMRIATTASPISGAEVRDRMQFIAEQSSWNKKMNTFRMAVRRFRTRKEWAMHLANSLSPKSPYRNIRESCQSDGISSCQSGKLCEEGEQMQKKVKNHYEKDGDYQKLIDTPVSQLDDDKLSLALDGLKSNQIKSLASWMAG
jgi:hypothetical protein